jgi:hypothetical protein
MADNAENNLVTINVFFSNTGDLPENYQHGLILALPRDISIGNLVTRIYNSYHIINIDSINYKPSHNLNTTIDLLAIYHDPDNADTTLNTLARPPDGGSYDIYVELPPGDAVPDENLPPDDDAPPGADEDIIVPNPIPVSTLNFFRVLGYVPAANPNASVAGVVQDVHTTILPHYQGIGQIVPTNTYMIYFGQYADDGGIYPANLISLQSFQPDQLLSQILPNNVGYTYSVVIATDPLNDAIPIGPGPDDAVPIGPGPDGAYDNIDDDPELGGGGKSKRKRHTIKFYNKNKKSKRKHYTFKFHNKNNKSKGKRRTFKFYKKNKF